MAPKGSHMLTRTVRQPRSESSEAHLSYILKLNDFCCLSELIEELAGARNFKIGMKVSNDISTNILSG